ncbi:hypothetical protein M8998_09265 [Sphingobacterium sp. lm-10]|uniref:hypothetical protein n=1 Tax=Sphingobacterium sp. lm-10 TaxID=2944904 RepID=UPI00202207C3|nr:hypothetical protein [Sphingobacterium sp. lm-10]MCL7988123.1 hypothetical protein [Sphingobacterium sp. lm-10]
MIRILSLLLLCIYTLTSTGATVYYHTCGQNSQISLSIKKENVRSCIFCSGEEKPSSQERQHCEQSDHSCEQKDSCCTDVEVELNNGDNQAVTNLLKDFNTLSPAEFIIPWIMVFHHSWLEVPETAQTSFSSLTPSGTFPNPYLVHCNFRI